MIESNILARVTIICHLVRVFPASPTTRASPPASIVCTKVEAILRLHFPSYVYVSVCVCLNRAVRLSFHHDCHIPFLSPLFTITILHTAPSATSIRRYNDNRIDYGSSTYDNAIDDYQKDISTGDVTGRTSHYMVSAGARIMYGSMARLTVMKLVHSLSASADVLALSTIEVDISGIQEGTTFSAKWRGKPVFIRHRTADEIAQARADDGDLTSFRDPETDGERVQDAEGKYIVVIGVCTHLGCVPIDRAGDYGAWFCPCHGSHYDQSGRIRKGPAPLNLEVPAYKYLDEKTLLIG